MQRELSIRGTYRGKLTGLMVDKTRDAIRKFQQARFESGNLTVAYARALGSIAIPHTVDWSQKKAPRRVPSRSF